MGVRATTPPTNGTRAAPSLGYPARSRALFHSSDSWAFTCRAEPIRLGSCTFKRRVIGGIGGKRPDESRDARGGGEGSRSRSRGGNRSASFRPARGDASRSRRSRPTRDDEPNSNLQEPVAGAQAAACSGLAA